MGLKGVKYMKTINVKRIIIKSICMLCLLIVANSALNILDYTAKNALAVGQMDIYGGQAFLQFYTDLAAMKPIIFVVIIAFVFRREIKAFISKIKNKENKNEENT